MLVCGASRTVNTTYKMIYQIISKKIIFSYRFSFRQEPDLYSNHGRTNETKMCSGRIMPHFPSSGLALWSARLTKWTLALEPWLRVVEALFLRWHNLQRGYPGFLVVGIVISLSLTSLPPPGRLHFNFSPQAHQIYCFSKFRRRGKEARILGESPQWITWPCCGHNCNKKHILQEPFVFLILIQELQGLVRGYVRRGLLYIGDQTRPLFIRRTHKDIFREKARVWFSSHPTLTARFALVLHYSFNTEPVEKNHIANGSLLLYSKTNGCISFLYLLLYTYTLFHVIQYKLLGLCWLRYGTLMLFWRTSGWPQLNSARSYLMSVVWSQTVRFFLFILSIENHSKDDFCLVCTMGYLKNACMHFIMLADL